MTAASRPCSTRPGAAQADLVAALTGDDEDNLVVSFLCKTTHQVPMVFARTNHPKNEWMFTKTWGVDVAVSTAQVIYSLIEKEVSLGDVITLMALSAENMVIDEVTLPADAEAVGKKLSELAIPKCAHVMAIISDGRGRGAARGHDAECGRRGADSVVVRGRGEPPQDVRRREASRGSQRSSSQCRRAVRRRRHSGSRARW